MPILPSFVLAHRPDGSFGFVIAWNHDPALQRRNTAEAACIPCGGTAGSCGGHGW